MRLTEASGTGSSPSAASRSSFVAPTPRSSAASTPCSMPSSSPSVKATAFSARSPTGKIDELIAHTYKGDHER